MRVVRDVKPAWIVAVVIGMSVAFAGCGTADAGPETGETGQTDGDAEPDPDPEPVCDPAAAVKGTAITGFAYVDENTNDESIFRMGLEEGEDTPLDGLELTLISTDGERTATACAEGDYGIDELADGVHVVAPTLPNSQRPCTSRNCPRHFPEAVRSGKVKIVTIGDSIAVVGGQPFFPERLATLISPLAEVDNKNVAVGGSTSPQWLPGTSYFEDRLRPELADADVVVITLGGNDLLVYIQSLGPAALQDLEGAIEGAHSIVQAIMENIVETAAEIRAANPDADIVYCLYPNYGQATTQFPWNVVSGMLEPSAFVDLLTEARQAVPAQAGLVLADMFGSFEGLPLDDYLHDSLHMNDLGAVHYAETVFVALGGVVVGESPLENGSTPLGLDKNYALAPAAE